MVIAQFQVLTSAMLSFKAIWAKGSTVQYNSINCVVYEQLLRQ